MKGLFLRSILLCLFLFMGFIGVGIAQKTSDKENVEVFYSAPQKYILAGVEIKGIAAFDESERDYLAKFVGLVEGDIIQVPGDEITRAVRKLYNQKSFSNVSIVLEKVVADSAYISVNLEPRHQLSKVNYWGLKRNEEDKVKEALNFEPGLLINDFLIENIRRRVQKVLEEKGFYEKDIKVVQRDDPNRENFEIIDVFVDREAKIRIKDIYISGNDGVKKRILKRAMKNTKERSLGNIFRSSKFVPEKYEEDKGALIDKYNEKGYRDAIILSDSIARISDKKMNIYLNVEEGSKYFFNDITWLGNTVYDSEILSDFLNVKKGEVYNKKHFDEQLSGEDGVINTFYANKGYLFARTMPTERVVGKDSINVEIRLIEGTQATINNVNITGNDKTHEHVIRRELYVYPGELYSREDLVRSVRELANLGHFDPESIQEGLAIEPNIDNGTVDITFDLKEKGNDRFELSGGWGAGMIIGSVGFTFTNFSIRNIFDLSTYKPLPQGDGQTLSLNAQTNGKYYTNFSLSFMEPWLGGKKPNSLSFSVFYSHQSGYSSSYYRNSYYYNSGGESASDYDTDKHINIWGFSLGLGRRVKWPDDYFTITNELSFQHYNLKNWSYYLMEDGVSNNLSLKTTVQRSSIDNPLYTRYGSDFSLSLAFTPPYSLFNGKDYANKNMEDEERYRWIEYHKWKFDGKMYIPLDKKFKTVLYMNAQCGYLGHYDKDLRSPFEGFEMGGDGMTGYSLYGREYIGLRGYSNGSLTNAGSSFDFEGTSDASMYSKLTMELRYPVALEDAATIYLLTFFEAGNSWTKIRDFEPFNLYRSAGIGLRVFLPMLGLLGVDWGYGFDDIDGRPDANGAQIHFILGQQF